MSQVIDFAGEPPTVFTLVITFAAFLAALGVIWKAPPFRRPAAFVTRRLIGEPVSEWFRALLREEATRVIQTELKEPNGGASIPDMVEQMTLMHNSQMELSAYTHDGIHELRNQLTPAIGKLELMWEQFAKDQGIEETE